MAIAAKPSRITMKDTPASKVQVVYNGTKSRHVPSTHHEGGGEDGEGTWIFSYADMITILMMFFILLLSISSMDVQKFEQLKGAMATSASQKEAGESGGNAGENAAITTSGISETRTKYSTEPGIGVVPFRVLAKKATELSAADSNTQIIAAMQTLLESIDQEKIDKSTEQAKTFEAMREKVGKLTKVLQQERAIEGRENQEIKISFSTKGLFTSKGAIKRKAQPTFRDLADSIVALDPFPQVIISSFVSPSEEQDASKAVLLSNIRASAVFAILAENNLKPHLMAMAGYGHSRVQLNETDSYGNPIPHAAQQNSRIEISILRRKDYRK